MAATIACAQQDIKKVLAYSTVSQLGYMFLAIGCGAYAAAIFLMVAHAFFKGLLFLGAGSVIHGLHDEQDLKRMGNLRAYLPITFITFAIGWLCIAAVPPLSGFWAKGDILDNTWAAHPALWVVGIVTAALTAYYMSRLTGLAFFGKDRWAGAEAGTTSDASPRPPRRRTPSTEPHESPWIMTVPLCILAFFAAVAGVMAIPGSRFSLANWVDPVFGSNLFHDNLRPRAAVGPGHRRRGRGHRLRGRSGCACGRPGRSGPRSRRLPAGRLVHQRALRHRLRPPERAPGRLLADVVDPKVIDGAVNGVAGAFRGSGSLLRRTQTGYVRNYLRRHHARGRA